MEIGRALQTIRRSLIDLEEGLKERQEMLLLAGRKNPCLAAASIETLSPKVTWTIERAPMELQSLAEISSQGTEGTLRLPLTSHSLTCEGRNKLKK